MGITKKQTCALRFVTDCIVNDGQAPTIAEIQSALGLRSKAGAVHIIQRLEERGCLVRFSSRARDLRIVRDGKPWPPLFSKGEEYERGLAFVRALDVPLPVQLHGMALDNIRISQPVPRTRPGDSLGGALQTTPAVAEGAIQGRSK